MTVSSSTDVFHLSVVQDCHLVPGLHQRENRKVRHEIRTKVSNNCAGMFSVQHELVNFVNFKSPAPIIVDLTERRWFLVGVVKHQTMFKVSETALRQMVFFRIFSKQGGKYICQVS